MNLSFSWHLAMSEDILGYPEWRVGVLSGSEQKTQNVWTSYCVNKMQHTPLKRVSILLLWGPNNILGEKTGRLAKWLHKRHLIQPWTFNRVGLAKKTHRSGQCNTVTVMMQLGSRYQEALAETKKNPTRRSTLEGLLSDYNTTRNVILSVLEDTFNQ